MRKALWALMVGVLIAGLFACTIQIDTPKLEISPKPVYSQSNVLIPYSVTGISSEVDIEWDFHRYDTDSGEWRYQDNRHTWIPVNSAGILQMDLWDNGLYRLTASKVTTYGRGGIELSLQNLTQDVGFYVDTESPAGTIELHDDQGGGPNPNPGYLPNTELTVTPTFAGDYVPYRDTPVELYYVLDSTDRPTVNDNRAEGGVQISDGSEAAYNHILTIVAIDEAGNVGSYRVAAYRAP